MSEVDNHLSAANLDPGDEIYNWTYEEDNNADLPTTQEINEGVTQKRPVISEDDSLDYSENHSRPKRTKVNSTDYTDSTQTNNHAIKNKSKGTTILIMPTDNNATICSNPVAISRGLTKEPFNKIIPKDVRINKRRNLIALELDSKDLTHIEDIMSATHLDKYSIKCYQPKSEIICSGVIGPIDVDQAISEIRPLLKCYSAKIVEVVRLFKFRNTASGMKEPAKTLKLIFEGKVLPEKIYVGSISFPVTQYNLPPLRCYRCQKLGHMASGCTRRQICNICSGEHRMQDCTNKDRPRCCNCRGEHAASSHDCIHNKDSKNNEVDRRSSPAPSNYHQPISQHTISKTTLTQNMLQGSKCENNLRKVSAPVEVHRTQGSYEEIPTTSRSYAEIVKETVNNSKEEIIENIKHYIDEIINNTTVRLTSFMQEVFSLQLQKESIQARKLILLNLAKHHFGHTVNFSALEGNLCFNLPQYLVKIMKGKMKK